MKASFCDAVVIGSTDVRQHQVCSTVFSNHKTTVMEKEACHQVPKLKLQRCRRLASDLSIFQRKLNNFFNDTFTICYNMHWTVFRFIWFGLGTCRLCISSSYTTGFFLKQQSQQQVYDCQNQVFKFYREVTSP
jgi:hypothetical protein